MKIFKTMVYKPRKLDDNIWIEMKYKTDDEKKWTHIHRREAKTNVDFQETETKCDVRP